MTHYNRTVTFCVACVLVLFARSWICADPGSPVPDSLASTLRGGCAGAAPYRCEGQGIPCAALAVCEGSDFPNSNVNHIVVDWCTCLEGGHPVCQEAFQSAYQCIE